jgi:hypothetical protein
MQATTIERRSKKKNKETQRQRTSKEVATQATKLSMTTIRRYYCDQAPSDLTNWMISNKGPRAIDNAQSTLLPRNDDSTFGVCKAAKSYIMTNPRKYVP